MRIESENLSERINTFKVYFLENDQILFHALHTFLHVFKASSVSIIIRMDSIQHEISQVQA